MHNARITNFARIFTARNMRKYIAAVSHDRICIYLAFNMASFPLLDGTLKYRPWTWLFTSASSWKWLTAPGVSFFRRNSKPLERWEISSSRLLLKYLECLEELRGSIFISASKFDSRGSKLRNEKLMPELGHRSGYTEYFRIIGEDPTDASRLHHNVGQ